MHGYWEALRELEYQQMTRVYEYDKLSFFNGKPRFLIIVARFLFINRKFKQKIWVVKGFNKKNVYKVRFLTISA